MTVLLDLFCGGGGAAMGYRRAGFTVIGIDSADHRASFCRIGEFQQMDWRQGLHEFSQAADVIHASPPCQRYSQLTKWGRRDNVVSHADLIESVRQALIETGKPYIIENVERAPLINPIRLCAWSFGYEHYRHRLFETNLAIPQPPHRKHALRASSPGHFRKGSFVSIGGHFAPARLVREVMGIDWMTNEELAEAIPPYYAEYLGRCVLEKLRRQKSGPEARKLIWSLGRPGRPRKGTEKRADGTLKRGTNSRAYILARLERDGFGELAARVHAGEMSAAAAAREARASVGG